MQSFGIGAGAFALALLGLAQTAFAVPPNNVDKQFMISAARTDMVEAHEGQMAESQAQRSDVRDLAKSIVQDHTDSYGSLTALANKDGVTLPKGINAAKDRNIEPLMHLKGDRFDRAFVREEIAADQRVLAEFKREAERGKDADVKAYANRMIPILEKHLKEAQDCEKPATKKS